MELSNRLKFISEHIERCESIIDVGSDHGYIPIYAVKKGLCNTAIASDINKGPVEKAKINAQFEGVGDKVEVRLGGGLSTVKKGEVDAVVIAGMGGNLIRDILESDKDKLASFKFMILQPAQNPEVLRKYLYTNGYEIITEDLCNDEGIYYELFKVRKSDGSEIIEVEDVYYEFSPILLKNKHKLMTKYLKFKQNKYEKILSFITDDSDSALNRKREVHGKLQIIDDLIRRISNGGNC